MGESQKLRNIEPMLSGYDAVRFDPLNPGGVKARGRVPVFDLDGVEWKDSGNVSYPSNMYYFPNPLMEWNSKAESYQSTTTFTESFSINYEVSLGGEVSGFSGAFSASQGYEEVREKTRSTQSFVTMSTAEVNLYDLSWDEARVSLSESFVDAVKSLPVEGGPEYTQFIGRFGTHFIRRAAFGGRGVRRSVTTSGSVAHMLSEKMSIGAGAEASFGLAAKVSGLSETELKRAHEFNSSATDQTLKWIGGLSHASSEHSSESFGEWVQTVPDRPVVRSALFEELFTLFTRDLIDDENIETKRERMKQVVLGLFERAAPIPLSFDALTDRPRKKLVLGYGLKAYCPDLREQNRHTVVGLTLKHDRGPNLYLIKVGKEREATGETIRTHDRVHVVMSRKKGPSGDRHLAGLYTYKNGGMDFFPLGTSELSAIFKLRGYGEGVIYKLIDPEAKSGEPQRPILSGKQYLLLNEGYEAPFYLSDPEIQADPGTGGYHATLPPSGHERTTAGKIWIDVTADLSWQMEDEDE